MATANEFATVVIIILALYILGNKAFPVVEEYEPVALTEATTDFLNKLSHALDAQGYTLLSVGEILHYSISDVVLKDKLTSQVQRVRSITFLPNPQNGIDIKTIIFEP